MMVKNKRKLLTIKALFVSLIIILSVIFSLSFFSNMRLKEYNDVYEKSFTSPSLVHAFFLNDLQKDVNDDYTKYSAYLVIYRYFINGGNIYEVYNYINNHKELSFLKDAEAIYPEMFNDVRVHKLPFTYSDQGMYVSLAYFEVLEKYGYAGIDTLGTLSGQYAKMAYYKKMIISDKKKGLNLDYPDYTEEQVQHDINKSQFFLRKAEGRVTFFINTSKKNKEKYNYNIIKGLVEYASAIRYLETLNLTTSSSYSSKEIFDFLTKYTHQFIPGLYFFVNISNASTLVIAKKIDKLALKNSLYPLLSYNLKTAPSGSIIGTVLLSKYDNHISRFADLTIVSKTNVLLYAKNNLEFKDWLIANGWKDSDFD